nr:hypothetical protein [Nitrosomonas sp.]
MRAVPAPDRGVARVHDHPRGVEVVGVDVMHLDRIGGGGFRDYRNRNVAQPDGFLSHQPVIGLCRACIVAIFPDQLSVGIVEEQKPRTQRAVLDDALIQRVIFVSVCLAAFDRSREFSGGVPGKVAVPSLNG